VLVSPSPNNQLMKRVHNPLVGAGAIGAATGATWASTSSSSFTGAGADGTMRVTAGASLGPAAAAASGGSTGVGAEIRR
jgi:hypothetical protein